MRVIAGQFKGYRIDAPEGNDIRPTTDRIKENMFNVLQNYIYSDTRFLDLFAGTGAIGIEALSRGCEHATFVDTGTQALKLITANTKRLKVPERVRIVRSSVEQFLIASHNRYDIIFMDPPYADRDTDRLMEIIYQNDLLAPDGIVITEKAKSDPYEGDHFELFREQKYSTTVVRYYRKKYGE